jgi:hypothetical protein
MNWKKKTKKGSIDQFVRVVALIMEQRAVVELVPPEKMRRRRMDVLFQEVLFPLGIDIVQLHVFRLAKCLPTSPATHPFYEDLPHSGAHVEEVGKLEKVNK